MKFSILTYLFNIDEEVHMNRRNHQFAPISNQYMNEGDMEQCEDNAHKFESSMNNNDYI